ncbi:flagellar biosynthesis protein FlgN, partial [Escherichia marmotae]|nr:flagellar biosynthesis protein FlgN [Escherichia marmotae]
MTLIADILDLMSAVLNYLKRLREQELQLLSMGQFNGSVFQWITVELCSVLASLDYVEQLGRQISDA